jgi:hypothetical protein
MPSDAIDSRRAAPTRSGSIRWLGSLALVLGSLVVGLMALELGCRLVLHGPAALLHWPNLVVASRIAERTEEDAGRGPSYRHDPVLGFVNTPGYVSQGASYDAQGFRRTPMLGVGGVAAPPILATGDSYTKGDEADDFGAWPSWLQEIVGVRTVNAGVGGYGLDQAVLMTERLVPRLRPGVLVVGFIADDVRRIEMSRLWGREKPYFDLTGSGLVLRNVPVPLPPDPRDSLSPLQAAFGWSVLLDTVLDRLRLRNIWHMDHVSALPSGAGERLACPLMQRLAALGVPTLVVAQYLPTAWEVPAQGVEERRVARVVLECAARTGLHTLDTWSMFDEAIRAGGRKAVYAQWHPNGRGYRMTAEAIADTVAREKLLP